MDMDDAARTAGSPPSAATARDTISSAAHNAARGVRSLAARAAESLARGLVTCVFAAVGTLLGAITGGLIGLATETGVVRGTGVGGITGALVSMEVVDSSLAMWRSDEYPAFWTVVYVLDVIWSLLTGRLVREKVDPAVLSAVESQVRTDVRERFSPIGGAHSCSALLVFFTSRATRSRSCPAVDERGGVAGGASRRSRHFRDRRHQRHAEDGHRRAPRRQVRRERRRPHRLFGLPTGVRSRRERQESPGVPPHVPPALHRRLAAPARVLPFVPARALACSGVLPSSSAPHFKTIHRT